MSAPDGISGLLIRQSVRELLRKQVLQGRLRDGESVSPIELAAELGISATPLREAMIELTRDGYFEARPRRGFAVRLMTASEAADLYATMADLEALVISRTPPHAEDLTRMERINFEMSGAQDGLTVHRLDFTWHDVMISRNGNAVLREMISLTRQRVERYEVAYFRLIDSVKHSTSQHAEIVSAFREGDIDRARQLVGENWRCGFDRLGPLLEARPPRPDQ